MKFFLFLFLLIPSLAFPEKLKFAVNDSRFYMKVFSDSQRNIYLVKDLMSGDVFNPDNAQPTGLGGLRLIVLIDEHDGLKSVENFDVSPRGYMDLRFEYDRLVSSISLNCLTKEYFIWDESYFKDYESVGTNTFNSYISWRTLDDNLSYNIHNEHGFKEMFDKVCLMYEYKNKRNVTSSPKLF